MISSCPATAFPSSWPSVFIPSIFANVSHILLLIRNHQQQINPGDIKQSGIWAPSRCGNCKADEDDAPNAIHMSSIPGTRAPSSEMTYQLGPAPSTIPLPKLISRTVPSNISITVWLSVFHSLPLFADKRPIVTPSKKRQGYQSRKKKGVDTTKTMRRDIPFKPSRTRLNIPAQAR